MAFAAHQTGTARSFSAAGQMELRLSTPAERTRGGDDFRNGDLGQAGNAPEGLLDLPLLERQLMGVRDVLHPAAAATGVIRAERSDPMA